MLRSRCFLLVMSMCGAVSVCSVIPHQFAISATAADDTMSYVNQHYPDFGFLPSPKDYKGRVFRLSQKSPKTEPALARRPAFLEIDFKSEWRKYLDAAQDYCFRDNVLGADVSNDFEAANKENPTWFHVPWQHYGPNGREGVHGLTKEAPVQLKQLEVAPVYEGANVCLRLIHGNRRFNS